MQTTLSKFLSRLFPPAATLVALLFCLPTDSHAIFNNWSSSGPAGAVVKSLAIDPATPTTIYAGTANAGVYKSTNGGSTWNSANSGLPGNAAINALRLAGSSLYAGSQGNGLFKSSGGASWSTVNGGWAATANISAVVGNGTDIYVAINGGGVYKGAGGTTWVSLNATGLTSGNILSLAVVPTSPATLYAGSNGSGAFRSTDDGATWASLNTGLPGSSTITALAVDSSATPFIYAGTDLGKVYRIANNSSTWSETTTQPSSGVAISGIVTKGTEIYVMTAGKGLFHSTDGGATWSPLNSTLPNTTVNALALDPISTFNLYAGTGGGIFKSTNSGITWGDSNSGLLQADIRAFAINPTTQSLVYAGSAGGGVFKSSNGGAAWLPVNTGLTNTFVNALAIDSGTPSTLYAATGGGIFKTINSGTSWTAATTQPTTLDVRALVIDPGNPATLYAGTAGGGVFRSINSGDAWAAYNTGLTDLNVVALAISASDLFAATSGSGVFHWGGTAWAAVNSGLTSSIMNALAIDSATPTTLFAGTNTAGVFKTVNSATTWNAANSGISGLSIKSFAISSTTPVFVTAGTNGGGVFFTTNGGTSWTAMNTGLPDLVVNALAANTATTKKVYAGSANSGIYSLNVSQISTVTPAGPTPASAVDFGKTNIGDTNGIDFTLGNSGTVALQLSSPTIAGVDSTLFTIANATTGSPCGSFPLTIAAGGSCTIKVNFAPLSVATTKSASLIVGSDAPNQPITVYLKGGAGPAPQAIITAPLGGTVRNPYPVAGTAVDNSGWGLAKVEVSFDSGTTWTPATITPAGAPNWNWSYSWTTGSNGTFGIRARATDNNGFVQTNFTGLTKTVTIDNTPPVTTISAKPPAPDKLKSGSFSFAASKGGSTFECRIDSAAFTSCTSPYAYGGLTDGAHTFNVQAYDGIPPAPGNKETTPQNYTWTVDTVPPTTTISGKPAAFTQSNMATLVFAANKPSTYSCTFDGGAAAPCSSPYGKGPLAEGSHSFTVQAIDQAGNQEITPTSYTWIVDTIKPTSTIAAMPAQLTGATYSFTGTASDGGSGVSLVEVSFGGSNWYPATDTAVGPALPWSSWNYLWTLPINGTYTLQVRSTDKAGNQQQTPASANFNVANPLPTLAITAPGNNALVGSASTRVINGTAAPNSGGLPLQKVQVTIFPTTNPPGTLSWTNAIGAATWSYNWTLPTDGLYTVQAQALDSAGNPFAVASNNVTVDVTPPTSTIAPANNYQRGNRIALTGTADDNLTGVRQVDIIVTDNSNATTTTPAAYNSVTKSWSFTSGILTDGSYRIQSRATDNAGNQQGIPANVTITLDNMPPVTTLTGKPPSLTNSPAPTFTFAANETATYACTLDGAASSCTSPKGYTGLTTGSHTFSVQATDLAGNIEPTPATYTWFVDLVPPVVTAVTPPDGSKRISVTGSPITVKFSKDLDRATVTAATLTLADTITGNTAVGTVSYDAPTRTVMFTQTGKLSYTTSYRATINGMADLAGNTLVPFSWAFSTDPDGDFNLDGRVDIADALECLKVAVGRQTPTAAQLLHGDVGPLQGGKPQPDGKIDISDAVVILEKVVGISTW